jgi:hypothetical protein
MSVATTPITGDSTPVRLCMYSGSTVYNGASVLRLLAHVP